MGRLKYVWERRNVLRRIARNWFLLLLNKPFERKGRRGDEAVVFVRMNARSRAYCFGRGLRTRHQVRTILITRAFDYRYLREAFDEIYVYFNYDHLRRLIMRLNRRYNLLAAVGMTQPARQTRELLDIPRSWPVLVDPYDSMWAWSFFAKEGFEQSRQFRWSAEEIGNERVCFERGDGILAGHPYIFKLATSACPEKPVLMLENACQRRFFHPAGETAGPKGDEWSVVYPGYALPMHWDRKYAGKFQLADLGPAFAAEKIHFHIYPSPHHEYDFPAYRAEAARNPYFHFHESVPFHGIHEVLRRYDFGWQVIDLARQPEPYSNPFITNNTTPGKTFTYLEAGLPIIINGAHCSVEGMVEKYGCGLKVDSDAPRGLRAIIEETDVRALRRGVERARADISEERRSAELLAFLRELKHQKNVDPVGIT